MNGTDDPRAGLLRAVAVWDGRRSLGVCDVTWRGEPSGLDAVVDTVAPSSASPTPSRAGSGTSDAGAGAAEFALIPGLVDTHVHLVGNAGSASADFMTWPLTTRPEERTLHALAQARRALAAGVTTLRDLSADDIQFSLRRAIDGGIVAGPRVQAHGMVSMTAGHGDLFTPAAIAVRPPTADGPDECRRLVRQFARAGADGIKIATSGGVLSVGDESAWRNHTGAEIAAIVDEAHALGMRVAAHAHTAAGIGVALAAGVDSLEHGTLITADQADAAAAAGVSLAPTLLINERIASGATGAGPAQVAKAAALVVERDELLADAASRGVDIVLGTDANGAHVAFGEQMAEVARMAVVLRWEPERALAAATSRAAAAIGRGHDLGRITPGHLADLVLLRGRPWEDLSALVPENVVAVISRGRVVQGAIPREVSAGR